MSERRDETNLPEIFPFFETMGRWEDPTAARSKIWVRFLSTPGTGRRRDYSFSRIFDSIDFLLFTCRRELRSAIALEPRGGGHWDRCRGYRFWVHEDLTPEDRRQIAFILGGHAPARLSENAERGDDLSPADRTQIADILALAQPPEENE